MPPKKRNGTPDARNQALYLQIAVVLMRSIAGRSRPTSIIESQ